MKYFQVETFGGKRLFSADSEEEAIEMYVESFKGEAFPYITDVLDVTSRQLRWEHLNKIAEDKHREFLQNAN